MSEQPVEYLVSQLGSPSTALRNAAAGRLESMIQRRGRPAPLLSASHSADREGGVIRWRFRQSLNNLDPEQRRQALQCLAEYLSQAAAEAEAAAEEIGES